MNKLTYITGNKVNYKLVYEEHTGKSQAMLDWWWKRLKRQTK